MLHSDFLNLVPKLSKEKLPGIDAHFKMAPEMRKKLGKELNPLDRNPKFSAVMCLFYPKLEETHIAFILRKSNKSIHSNQIGFPGGKVEKEDKNREETALRETEEEIGVKANDINVIKQLSDIYIPPSNYLVSVFMGFTNYNPRFKIQESEVEKLIEIPLKDTLCDSKIENRNIQTSYAKHVNVPVYTFTKPEVWGATAMMFEEVRTMMKNLI